MSAWLATRPQTKSEYLIFVFTESLIDDDDAIMELITLDLDETKECKRGRPTSTVWILFTNDVNPQNAKSVRCQHCSNLVNHHKKNECTKKHLNKCQKFCTFMNGLEDADRANWFVFNKNSVYVERADLPNIS